MLVHNHHSDKCERVAQTNFAEDFNKEIAGANRPQERKTPVATAGDEVEVTLTVAAFEACRHEPKTSTPPPLPTSKGWGTHVKANEFGSEFIEWYHRPRVEVNCGKYGCEKVGHPPFVGGK
jgi:hypothetical protein